MRLLLKPFMMMDRKLIRDLWRLKTQLIAISFVVACGIATFIMARSAVDSLEMARDIYYERYRMADVFAGAKRAPLILDERLRSIPGVAQVYPRIRFAVTLDVAGMDEPAVGALISVPDIGESPLNGLYLRRGRLLEPGETDSVLISEAFAEAHDFRPGDSLKAVINGRLRTLRIAGIVLSPEFVYSLGPGQIMPDDKRYGVLWMNRRALEAVVDMDGAFNNVVLTILPGANADVVMDDLDRLLAPYGGIDAYPRKDQLSNWFVENELTQLRGMAVIVPIIFLSVAAFLLNIVLSRQIATEREQIGIMKAMGMLDRSIGLHYVKFAAVVVLLGTALGTAIGAWVGSGLTEMYTQFFRFPVLAYVFDPATVSTGALISMLAAMVGAVGAVHRVATLPPAEAMRPAPPANYHKTVLEALHLESLLSQSARMIVRHLERRPGRAVLSVTGISLAVAILIASMFMIDALWHMIDVQYELANREDVTVTFNEPKAVRALDEVTHLPGVLAAEPIRSVPVRFRHGHLTHRTGITGIRDGGSLRRMIDANLNPVPMPDRGLMLSQKLAEILDVQAGGPVTLEVLEGRKPVREVVVAGVVQEYIGANAFMELDALNELMGEAPSISGAALLTEKGGDKELLASIKGIPQIAGTVLKGFAIQAVYDIMAEFIVQQTLFNTIFAGMIAFGVVYNTARISLSERARELASLRVLGFRTGEVAYVLLGELVLLVLVSLPIGIVLGWGLSVMVTQSLDTEMFRLPLHISMRTYGYAVLTVLVAALISGLVVWQRVLRLDIVEVLKTRE